MNCYRPYLNCHLATIYLAVYGDNFSMYFVVALIHDRTVNDDDDNYIVVMMVHCNQAVYDQDQPLIYVPLNLVCIQLFHVMVDRYHHQWLLLLVDVDYDDVEFAYQLALLILMLSMMIHRRPMDMVDGDDVAVVVGMIVAMIHPYHNHSLEKMLMDSVVNIDCVAKKNVVPFVIVQQMDVDIVVVVVAVDNRIVVDYNMDIVHVDDVVDVVMVNNLKTIDYNNLMMLRY